MSKQKSHKNLNFAHAYPQLAKEWHPKLNHPLKPTHFSSNNNQKVWWRCKNGHDWQGRIFARVTGLDCPECHHTNRATSSSAEVSSSVSTTSEKPTLNEQTPCSSLPLSEQFPPLKTEWLVEKNKGRELDEFSEKSNFQAWWQCSICDHQWQTPIKIRTKGSGCSRCAQRQRYVKTGENDLMTCYPTLAKTWHPSLNAKLTPSDFIATSKSEVWWKKECGHEYKRAIIEEVIEQNCIVCDSLAMKHPELMSQWHSELNKGIDPHQFSSQSNKKVFWHCSKGHDYQASIKQRLNHSTCPVCQRSKKSKSAKSKTSTQSSNLKQAFPSLAAQWHPTKNHPLTPSKLRPSSNRKVWWQCENGHEWQESPVYRQRASKCPQCQSVAFKSPQLMKLWHPTKNDALDPWQVRLGSQQMIWWKCSCGYEWQNEIKQQRYLKRCSQCGKSFDAKETNLSATSDLSNEPKSTQSTHAKTTSSSAPLTSPAPFDLWSFQFPHPTESSMTYLVFNHHIYKNEQNKAFPLSPSEVTEFVVQLFNGSYSAESKPCSLIQNYETHQALLHHLGFKTSETFKQGHWEGTEFLKLSNENHTLYLQQSFVLKDQQLQTSPCLFIEESIYNQEKQAYAMALAQQLRQVGIEIQLP